MKRLFNKKKVFWGLGFGGENIHLSHFLLHRSITLGGSKSTSTWLLQLHSSTKGWNRHWMMQRRLHMYHIASFALLGSCRTGFICPNFLHTMWEATEQQEISCNRYHVTDIRFIPTRNCPRFSFPWHQTCHRKIYHLYSTKLSCNSPWQFWSKLPW